MVKIMSTKSGIDSESFYGNKIKINRKKIKERDENQIPINTSKRTSRKDPDTNHKTKYRSPYNTPNKEMTSSFNSTEKFYRNHLTINSSELSFIENGFNNKNTLIGNNYNKRLNGFNFSLNSNSNINTTKPVLSTKVHMKTFLDELTANQENCVQNLNEVKTVKSPQKITHYFQTKQRFETPFNEIHKSYEKNVNKNSNSMNNTSPLISNTSPLISNNSNVNECQTPKSWRFVSNENQVNTRLFDSEYNELEENIVIDDQIFIDSPEKVYEPNTPIGLPNLGNTCYMNSMVQSLFALKFFINDLEIKFKSISQQNYDFSMTKTLLNLYNHYNGLRNRDEKSTFEDLSSHLLGLKQCVGQKSIEFLSGSQQDSSEFFNYVIDSIDEEFVNSNQLEDKNNPIWRNLSFETGGSLVCQKCQNKTQLPNETFNAFHLRIPEDNSLQTAFDDFLKDETTGHHCNNCDAKQNILSKCFTKLSKVLFLQLARYTHNGSKSTDQVLVPQVIYLSNQINNNHQNTAPSPLATPYRSKLQNVSISNRVSTVVRKINFDNHLVYPNLKNLSHSFENSDGIESKENDFNEITANVGFKPDLSQQISETIVSKDNNRVKYQLMAVICHHGISLSVGHYTCYVYSIENDIWFECDDNRITKTDFKCVQKYSQMSGYCYFYVLS